LKYLKIILFFLITLTQILFASKVEVTSDTMNANDLKKEVHFIGNAKVKQLKDWIDADKIIVFLDENNKAKMYEAIGNVTFEFENEKGHYVGSSDRVKYYPLTSLYILIGKAKVNDLLNKRTAKGDEITVDMTTGNSEVKGTKKKPVKFTFETDKE
jgi:lipopolysaccharide export system protein LptA